jgi:hypothetical protein
MCDRSWIKRYPNYQEVLRLYYFGKNAVRVPARPVQQIVAEQNVGSNYLTLIKGVGTILLK